MDDRFIDDLSLVLDIEGKGDEAEDGSSLVYKGSIGELQMPRATASHSQPELIRRATPKGKSKGGCCSVPQLWGVNGVLVGVA